MDDHRRTSERMGSMMKTQQQLKTAGYTHLWPIRHVWFDEQVEEAMRLCLPDAADKGKNEALGYLLYHREKQDGF